MGTPPPSLSTLERYLRHARQLDKHDPLMAYHCKNKTTNTCHCPASDTDAGRYYAAQVGVALRPKQNAEKETDFLLGLMDRLEADKRSLADRKLELVKITEGTSGMIVQVCKIADLHEERQMCVCVCVCVCVCCVCVTTSLRL